MAVFKLVNLFQQIVQIGPVDGFTHPVNEAAR
jgi:hypothetical protein